MEDTPVGAVTIALIVWLQRTRLGALGLVVAIVAGSTLAAVFNALGGDVPQVRDIANVPSGLPLITMPLLRDVPARLLDLLLDKGLVELPEDDVETDRRDEACHHGVRDEPDEGAQAQESRCDHHHTGHDRQGEQRSRRVVARRQLVHVVDADHQHRFQRRVGGNQTGGDRRAGRS